MKKKILVCTEFTKLSTGYANYGRNLLQRLHAQNDKYIVAEFATYGNRLDPRSHDIPWAFYGTLPDPNNQEQHDQYNSDINNQFGKWKLEETLLDFKPDIVVSFRDTWMDSFINESPYRDYFYHVNMPAVDASPQAADWIANYMEMDAVITYTYWANTVLEKQGIKRPKLLGVASPCGDSDYRPLSKDQTRDFYGLDKNWLIVGTVQRSQKRKLFSDLFESFAGFLKKAPKEMADKTYLYCHTSYPEGWQFNELLKEFGLGSKVLFTYNCVNNPGGGKNGCNRHFTSYFVGAKTFCKHCGQYNAEFTNTQYGLHTKELNQIINTFDVYVQYAACEGFAIPIVEAASTGLQVMCVDYSAMEDFKNTVSAIPIKVQRYNREIETGRYWALPDNNDLIAKLIKYLGFPKLIREKNRAKILGLVRQHYNWEKTVKVWTDYFDSVPSREAWKSPPKIIQSNLNIPNIPNNTDFVHWCFYNILGIPRLANSYSAFKMINDLNNGFTIGGGNNALLSDLSALAHNTQQVPYSRQNVVDTLKAKRDNINKWEQIRWQRCISS